MWKSFILFILVCALSCTEDVTKSTDQENIQGEWLAQTESVNGITKNVSYLYAFNGDTVSFTDETGKMMKYSFNLDTTGPLSYMLIRPEGAAVNSKPVSVAYNLKADTLTLVIAPEGLRPTEMTDKNNQELIISTRKKS
jgi:uncharacterized protein (TIGR03067 family)